jgi:DNA-binding NtrC family response regulator
MPTVLIIDAHSESLLKLSESARRAGFSVYTARNLAAARKALARRLPEVSVINLHDAKPQENEAALKLFARNDLTHVMEIYLVSAQADFQTALRGMQVGASDYFRWPDDANRLLSTLEELREEIETTAENRGEVHQSGRGLLQGESPAMNRVYRMMRKVAPTEATVFLVGESGSGKELIARSIHGISPRRTGPFVAMNCGAIASELVESEMFGHRKGAFTGAQTNHKGFFERADKGTLLLDEITEMDPDLQVKLLRVLERRRIRPVGGEQDIKTDVRIIASTNRNLQKAVQQGALREDLYYRLAEFPIRVPPLRERGSDVVLLARTFLSELNARERCEKSFSGEALDLLRLHTWPGNVRELKNAVSQAFILAADEILPGDLPENLHGGGAASGDYLRFPLGYNLKEMERRMILATLEHFENDKPRAAESLGISLKTLYNRLQKYNAG